MTPISPTLEGSGDSHRPKAPTHASNKAACDMTKIDLDVGVQESSTRPMRPTLAKVLGLVYGQIQFTLLLIALFVFVGSVKAFVVDQLWIILFLLFTWVSLTILLLTTKRRFGSNYFCKYTLAFVYTASLSYFVAAICSKIKINTILLAAGITTDIFFVLLVLCLFAKIGDLIWLLISFVACLGVVSILNLSGSLNNAEQVENTVFLSIFIVALLIDLHKILGIGWFKGSEATPDMCLYSSLAFFREIMMIFIYLIFLIAGLPRKK